MKLHFVLYTLQIFCCTKYASTRTKVKKIKAKNSNNDFAGLSSFPTNFFTDTYKKFVNDRPTIGVVAMRLDGEKILKEAPLARHKNYFGASFVKLVESAGGRAVPILEDIVDVDGGDNSRLKKLLSKINGIILPGGDGDLGNSGYEAISRIAVDYSKEQAKKGIPFPVIGICRGSQMILGSEYDEDVLTPTDSSNVSLPLIFTAESKHSKLFGKAPKALIKALQKPITFNAHMNSVTTKTFYNLDKLRENYRVLTKSYDREGVEFLSTYEGRYAPLYGFQWHPEKSLTIFNPTLAVDHSIFAVTAAQYVANVFIGDARQNPNRFKDRREEEHHLIFRHYPFYVGNITETPYEQIYLFDFVDPFVAKEKVKFEDLKGDEDPKTSCSY